jgi:fibronectin-binding autotransporter adhesin
VLYSGSITLSANGSIQSPNISLASNSALVFDNSGTPQAGRVSGTGQIQVQGGSIEMIGNSATAVDETCGTLYLAGGASSISVVQSGSAGALLDFGGFLRAGFGTLNVTGSGVSIAGLALDATGILAPYVTYGNDWATLDANGRITPYSNYASSFTNGLPGDNVRLIGSGTTSLAASMTRNSINVESDGMAQTLDLGPQQNLEVTSGGILESGSGGSTIQNGTLSTPGAEWVVSTSGTLEIDSSIQEEALPTSLSKTGPGTLILGGSNNYSGTTTINQGTLAVSSDANLGTGSMIEFGGGTLQALAAFSSPKGFLPNTTTAFGAIDTNGFDIAFSGSNSIAFTKTGGGSLTLTSPFSGNVNVGQGSVIIPNAVNSSATLSGGTLETAGTLAELHVMYPAQNATLDIGGTAAASLTVNQFDMDGSTTTLTVNFGIANQQSDFLVLDTDVTLPSSSNAFLFNFSAIGTVSTGTTYQILTGNLVLSEAPANFFGFSQADSAVGWSGTFIEQGSTLEVEFSSVPGAVPKPGYSLLVFLVSAGICVGARTKRQR